MNNSTPSMTLSPQAGLLLTKITDTSDLETALWRVLHDYTALKTHQLRQQITAFELKWDMSFDEFARRCEQGTLTQDPYAYDVESDYWDWEKAVTLLNHYEGLQTKWM